MRLVKSPIFVRSVPENRLGPNDRKVKLYKSPSSDGIVPVISLPFRFCWYPYPCPRFKCPILLFLFGNQHAKPWMSCIQYIPLALLILWFTYVVLATEATLNWFFQIMKYCHQSLMSLIQKKKEKIQNLSGTILHPFVIKTISCTYKDCSYFQRWMVALLLY
jgi:hypothetical protein